MLKLSLENKLYRKASWSDISSQRKCILGFYCGVCVCMCAYVWACMCLKGVAKERMRDGYSPEMTLHTAILTAYYLYPLVST